MRPKFGLALSWLAGSRNGNGADHIVNIGRRAPTERFVHLLLEIYSVSTMAGRASESRFDLPFSQEAMSDPIGLSVPHLNRALAKSRTECPVKVNGCSIEFADRD
jgi:hypothetical protein